MKVLEYRIVMPLTLAEYERGHLYSVCKSSRLETGAGEGFEFLVNEPFEDARGKGQFTHKIIHLHTRLPRWVTLLLPSDALTFEEKCWNQYPYVRTEYSCPYFGDKLQFRVETIHRADNGSCENAHNLEGRLLQKRKVDLVDIAHDAKKKSYESRIKHLGPDPAEFCSETTARGPLTEGWIERAEPVMCAYKLAVIDVDLFGIQRRVEKLVQKQALRTEFYKAHRKLFCWIDEWHPLSMQQVREYEVSTKQALHRMVRGADQPEPAAPEQQVVFGMASTDGMGSMDEFGKHSEQFGGSTGDLMCDSSNVLSTQHFNQLAEPEVQPARATSVLCASDLWTPPKQPLELWWQAQLARCVRLRDVLHSNELLLRQEPADEPPEVHRTGSTICAARRGLSEARGRLTCMREQVLRMLTESAAW
eukprot:TRINITY_DN4122_c0_g1_i1.p1 TRINITY_DN4122_c0_g1~~TRINITY_DN4122_c0_g1_i1.p1  ORF type:complete len:419 (+),score=103.32 TRINITY_DN4122_c0_g1_i1:54-1310(+)